MLKIHCRHLILSCVLSLLAAHSPAYAASLPADLQRHIDYLASDELKGRGLGTPELQKAANYIAEQFAKAGLKPSGGTGFFQSFEVATRKQATDEGFLQITPGEGLLKRDLDFAPLSFSSDDFFEGEVVFCGYGIESEARGIHDFAHLELKGKVALVLLDAPAKWQDDAEVAALSLTRAKVYACKERGAVGVLFVAPQRSSDEADRLAPFETDRPDAYGLPAVQITRGLADRMLFAANKDRLADIQKKLDEGGNESASLPQVRVKGRAGVRQLKAEVVNVVGVIPAEEPLADEFIVIGAHYDHLGFVVPWQRTFRAGQLASENREPAIHNGADDNASGTAGLIELAKIFACGPKLKRSLAFVAFTAEESGLHGSQYFVDHLPLRGPGETNARVVAMLNMDMIGRLSADGYLEIFGADSGEGLRERIERLKTLYPSLVPKLVSSTSNRSDDASFYRIGIPALHFCTGTHQDYHKPTDDADKINARGAADIVRFVADLARDLANADAAPTYVKLKTETLGAGGTPVYRVVMGVTPSYAEGETEPGMRIMDVNKDGPADLAGLKPNDRIIRIGSMKVNNIYDYMGALARNKAGDVVEVEVTRDGRNQVFKVTLAGARSK